MNGLITKSMVLAEQVTTISTNRLTKYLGELSHNDLVNIGKARLQQSRFPIK